MRVRLVHLVPLAAFACVVPAIPTTDDSLSETDTNSATDQAGDTDPFGDTDTDAPVPDTDAFVGPGDLTPLGCHPFDPASYQSWERRYSVSFTPRGGGGVETHTPLAWGEVPGAVAGPISEGWGVHVAVTGTGSNNYQSDMWMVCADNQNNPGAFDIGYTQTVGNKTIKAGADTPNKYLPDEAELYGFFAPAWQVDTKYFLKVPGSGITFPGCPVNLDARRDVAASYTGWGFETISVPALGSVEAYKLNVIVDQTQVELGTGNPLCDIFGELFAPFGDIFSIFGFDRDTGGFVTSTTDMWYVRGVGLVKAESTDYTTGDLLYSKNLTACSGLPECP